MAEHNYMTLDQFFAKMDEERRNRPWYQKLVDGTYRWTIYKPRVFINDAIGNTINVFQRARYGVGHRDLWHFPGYFSGVLAHVAKLEAEESMTYPGEERGFTPEKYKKTMHEMSRILREYQEAYDAVGLEEGWYEDLEAKQKRAVKEMHRFANLFIHMGD